MTKETKVEMERSRARLVQDYRKALNQIGDFENQRNVYEARLRWLAEHANLGLTVSCRAADNAFCLYGSCPDQHWTVVGPPRSSPLAGLIAAIDKARGR